MTTGLGKISNHPRTCFGCGERVFFCPLIRNPENQDKMLVLETEYIHGEEPIPHVCSQSNRTRMINNYEPINSRPVQTDVAVKNTKPTISQTDLDGMRNEIAEIRELILALTAMLENKFKSEGTSMIFQKASDMEHTEVRGKVKGKGKKKIDTDLGDDDYEF